MRAFIVALFATLFFGSLAVAQPTVLTSPRITYQNGPYAPPLVFLTGKDTGTGLPCLVGQTSTCSLATTGGSGSGAVGCNLHVFKHVTSATDTLVVQGVTTKSIKVCGVIYAFAGTAAQTVFLENTASLNANCSSANVQIAGAVVGNSSAPASAGFYDSVWGGLVNTVSNGLCLNSTGTGAVDVDVFYAQS